MSTVLTLRRPDEAGELAAALLGACPDRRVFAFQGDLGAGKTTLIKALCAQLGVEQGTGSPSFAIVNEYRTAAGGPVYHFDLYRLKDAGELEGIGFREYLDSGRYCFVEWPELARDELPPDTVHVRITAVPDGGRLIELDLIPAPVAPVSPA
jgi:tRNA threonylcarbamoyladenosine biosynthesis protein TsaE